MRLLYLVLYTWLIVAIKAQKSINFLLLLEDGGVQVGL